MTTPTRTCLKCNQSKPITELIVDRSRKDGYKPYCKECIRKEHAERYKNNPEYRQHVKDRAKIWKKNNRHKIVLSGQRRVCGMDIDNMIKDYGAKCAICGNKDVWLVVDHDHITGKARGPLCRSCNAGLGMFRDNTDLLKIAIAYLESGGVL